MNQATNEIVLQSKNTTVKVVYNQDNSIMDARIKYPTKTGERNINMTKATASDHARKSFGKVISEALSNKEMTEKMGYSQEEVQVLKMAQQYYGYNKN